MRKPFIVFGAPVIGADEIREVTDCLESGWLGTGPKVSAFEEAFRDYTQATHAVAVSSCTAALHLSLLALDLQPGDEVITTPLTFCATINAILHTGATPVLADIDPKTFNIDPEQVRARITPRTRALLPVHFAGRACDMDALMAIAAEQDLFIIEDCAHAIETLYKGRHVGTFGDFGCFSFYATKNITTGEGGMVLAGDEEAAARVKTRALHGMSKDAWRRYSDDGYKHYLVADLGFKYNMMDIQAAIGLHQLRRIEASWLRRQTIWQRYNEAFAGLPIALPPEDATHNRHAYHLYTVLVDEKSAGLSRDAFLDAMTQRGIGVGVHYLSIPEHPYYQERFGWLPDSYAAAQRVGRQTISLPLSPGLTDEEVDRVIDSVQAVLKDPARGGVS